MMLPLKVSIETSAPPEPVVNSALTPGSYLSERLADGPKEWFGRDGLAHGPSHPHIG